MNNIQPKNGVLYAPLFGWLTFSKFQYLLLALDNSAGQIDGAKTYRYPL